MSEKPVVACNYQVRTGDAPVEEEKAEAVKVGA